MVFQLIAADLDLNHLSLQNAPGMGLSKELKDSFTYSDISDELPAFVMDCQKLDTQIRQRRAELRAQNNRGGVCFAYPRPPALSKAPETAPAATVAGYTQPAPMDLSKGNSRISVEDRPKKFAHGWCLYGGVFHHRAADCMARKKTQTFKAAEEEVKKVVTAACSKGSGND